MGTITGHTGLLALIGSPVGHSASPATWNFSFDRLGLDYVYVAFDIGEEQVPDAMKAFRTLGIRGGNVTMPCKIAAAREMDELSTAARIAGAVNTIKNENGKLIGHITDGLGFVLNLKDNGVEIKGKKIVVAGGGGAATAIQVQCALSGAAEIAIFNRKDAFFERALQTAEKIREIAPDCAVGVYDMEDTERMTAEVRSAGILANATVAGMRSRAQSELVETSILRDLSALYPGLVVADAVYNPLETILLRDAKAAGCKCIDGRGMLMWQAAAGFREILGVDMPVGAVRERFYS
ncbi:shikimate dehydrogenase [Enterocloster asparagiformis]|uniref:shikimate dehydrogenase n=1 Tax=Enterocloster asparagiformis TaxID=333367 RepID=UPI002A801AA7|nr:shikimate dehydrogenase [Enterocloster asparagiformis]